MIEINKVIPPLFMLREIAEVLGYDEEIFQGDNIILPGIREEGIPRRFMEELWRYLEERRE